MRIGFRTWNLVDQDGHFEFQSVAITAYRWRLLGRNQSENMAGGVPRVAQPTATNLAGFYHYYDYDKAVQEYPSRGLCGACMCWGRIGGKDGERMFRAEYAQIVAVTEPAWEWFARPSAPTMPAILITNLWMVAITKERADLLATRDTFSRYLETLAQVLGTDISARNIEEIYAHFSKNRAAVEAQYGEYAQAHREWERRTQNWADDQSRRFRAQMPYPVFRSGEELVEYAQKFGELGPPPRSDEGS